jgi:thioredoxin-related protein
MLQIFHSFGTVNSYMMFNWKSRKWLLATFFITGISCFAFAGAGDDKEVHWMNFDAAVKLNQQHPKKIFIDVYTQWCGWCKKMDATTYTDPDIISYLNKNYYAVRLDAETADTFHFKEHKFFNIQPHTRGYANELAYSLLDGKLGYPTTVYMDENFNRLTYLQSYANPTDLMIILKFFAQDKYKTMSFEDFKKSQQTSGEAPAGK